MPQVVWGFDVSSIDPLGYSSWGIERSGEDLTVRPESFNLPKGQCTCVGSAEAQICVTHNWGCGHQQRDELHWCPRRVGGSRADLQSRRQVARFRKASRKFESASANLSRCVFKDSRVQNWSPGLRIIQRAQVVLHQSKYTSSPHHEGCDLSEGTEASCLHLPDTLLK